MLFPASRNNEQEGHFTIVLLVAKKTTDTGGRGRGLEMKGKGEWKANAMHTAQPFLLSPTNQNYDAFYSAHPLTAYL